MHGHAPHDAQEQETSKANSSGSEGGEFQGFIDFAGGNAEEDD